MQLQIDVDEDLPVAWATWRAHDQAGVIFRPDVIDLDRDAAVAGLAAAMTSAASPLETTEPARHSPVPPGCVDFWDRYPDVQLYG